MTPMERCRLAGEVKAGIDGMGVCVSRLVLDRVRTRVDTEDCDNNSRSRHCILRSNVGVPVGKSKNPSDVCYCCRPVPTAKREA
jgi:hypothetical protein